ncbi:MAG: hypothetical protein KAI71_03890 [Candidatus Pacebacteria bacterium]|nr:hypothetical protein [Candidatus Paceibacterota bacterium]
MTTDWENIHLHKRVNEVEEENKKEVELWSITETDDGKFEVIFPSVLFYEIEGYCGTQKILFESRDEAEKEVESSKKRDKILFELWSLKKSFIKDFYEIDLIEDDRFKVTIPAFFDSENGHYIGKTSKDFDSWDEAKAFYLEHLDDQSKLVKNPIIEIQLSETEKIAYSDLDNFDPIVIPSDKPKKIPKSVEKYMRNQEKEVMKFESDTTYQKTIKEDNWEMKLFGFISSYLKEEGKEIMEDLQIENLNYLTPRQAIDITTRIIVELTKYKWSDVKNKKDNNHLDCSKKTNADQSTTINLLKQGLANGNNDQWEGNGVCRNFASMTKAVFEAIKANQTKFNYLQDTYCLYKDGSDHKPQRKNYAVTETNVVGHAWNPFVAISENEANATIVDTTWAKKNLDTGEIEGLDHTLTRMEPVIHKIALNLNENTPNKNEQLEHILSYYALKIESPAVITYRLSSINKLDAERKGYYKDMAIKYFNHHKLDLNQTSENELINIGQKLIQYSSAIKRHKRETQFFVCQTVEILNKQNDIPSIDAGLLKAINSEYIEIAESSELSEIETLWQIKKSNPDFSIDEIIKNYFKNKTISDYNKNEIMTKNNELQQALFKQIKTFPNFEEIINNNPELRIRIRETMPELFSEFSPASNEADIKELMNLIKYKTRFDSIVSLLDKKTLTQENVDIFFEKAREKLKEDRPEQYESHAKHLDDYELIKQFNSFY